MLKWKFSIQNLQKSTVAFEKIVFVTLLTRKLMQILWYTATVNNIVNELSMVLKIGMHVANLAIASNQ